MAIRNRQGDFNNFEPNKMVSGEFAVVNSSDPSTSDGKGVYITFTGGRTKRLCTRDEVEGLINQAEEIKDDVIQLKDDVIGIKSETEDVKRDTETVKAETEEVRDETAGIRDNAEEFAMLSKSYAVGTNDEVREDSEDNAKYYKEWVQNALEKNMPKFNMNFETGHLEYQGGAFVFNISSNGHLHWALS